MVHQKIIIMVTPNLFFRVHAELVLSIQDQPERHGENYIALGISNYTACAGYLLNVNNVKDIVTP